MQDIDAGNLEIFNMSGKMETDVRVRLGWLLLITKES